ncbi:hypothetical protein HOA56_04710 [archaeon]|mgnify:CR=1 FL=1|jgi:hypothetical protein|nr:hypothetical protein [archaeon]
MVTNELTKTGLEILMDGIRKYLYIEDTSLLELLFAITISREQKNSKLWLIIIGNSGSGKTELLKLIDDEINTKTIKRITGNTLINGNINKKTFPDLVPKLRNKIMLMPEMATMLTLGKDERSMIWAQFRDLYDGVLGRQSGTGMDINYTDLNTTLIGCSTPAIDSHLILNQSLGSREFIYRSEDLDEEKLMKRIVELSTENTEEIVKNLKIKIQEFLKDKKYEHIEINKKTLETIKTWAVLTTKLRCPAKLDYNRTFDLESPLYPERPTRVLKQYITLFRCLKCLDENYSDERALKIIGKISLDSCKPIRKKILIELMANNTQSEIGLSQKQVGRLIKINKNTTLGNLNILSGLDLLIKYEYPIDIDRDIYKYTFKINKESKIIKLLSKHYGIELEKERIKISSEQIIEGEL